MEKNIETQIKENVDQILPEILSLHGVTGNEEDVADYVKQVVSPLVDSIETDTLGNVIAYKKGNSKKNLMIAAHMDEIGLLVKYIDSKGFIFVEPIGGVRAQNLYARECEIKAENGYISGVINSIQPGRPYGDDSIPEANDYFIDVGADNIQDIKEMGIEIGQPVKFKYSFQKLHNKISGTALDNRLLMFILIEVLKIIDDKEAEIPDIYAVFTVQEEVGCRGARTATHQIKPDMALALDITMANDLPKNHESEYISKLGEGPAIKVMDNIKRAMIGQVVSKKIISELKNVAKENNLPYQLEVQAAGSTDGATIHTEGAGVPTGALCLPTRYVHAHEVASVNDIVDFTELFYKSIVFYNK